MANTYTQIHLQCVMAVKYRQSLIDAEWKDKLEKYITGIVQNHDHKMLAIYAMPDHLHMFFGFRPNQKLSDLMQIVKGESSRWINKESFTPAIFVGRKDMGHFLIHVRMLTR
jgi:putative transposase